jgi:hypothetical protein
MMQLDFVFKLLHHISWLSYILLFMVVQDHVERFADADENMNRVKSQ